MGKVHCEACKKSCKGQAIRLQEKYFHIKCFKCKECSKPLGASGFYVRGEAYYCGEDYQKLFGTKCAACGQYVEGEVFTALNNTYHQACFHCTKCNSRFGAGDKVTYNGKDYLCNKCLAQSEAASSPVTEQVAPAGASNGAADSGGAGDGPDTRTGRGARPVASSTPAKPGANVGTPASALPDMSHILTDKENLTNGRPVGMLPSPHSTTSGYKSDVDDERNHDMSRDSRDSSVFDEVYLKVPVRRKTRADSGYMPSVSESCMDSVFGDVTDTEKQDRLSPMENIMQYRSPSPCSTSIESGKSRDSTASNSSRKEVDYGKFYKTSYLAKPMGVAKGPSINPRDKKPTHYHRPENFSYSQVRKDFIIPMKKESSSMMSALGDATKVTRKRLEDFMEEPVRNKEVIQMAKYPGFQRRDENELAPIEREDWPAPAAAAAAYPELLYRHSSTSSRRSAGGESSDMDATDGTNGGLTGDDEEVRVDPRIQKEIQHLSLLEQESGAAKVFLGELRKKAAEPPPLLDPISSSRTPNADKEPHYRTRYESHIFASPSRNLDSRYHPRTYSVDDQLLGHKFRNPLQSLGNYPAMKPGYTLRAQKTAHMPSTFASARANGYFSDIEQCVTRDSDFEDSLHVVSPAAGDRRGVSKTPSLYTSQSSIEEYDPHTGLRRGSRHRGSSISTDFSTRLPYKASAILNNDEPPKIYSYNELKLNNPARPPGTDNNWLEVHLSEDEFETLFRMKRPDFYRLAEWKRNDLKKRVLLF